MATIKLIFRKSSVANGEGTLFLRVIHRRIMHQIHTGCHIKSSDWDEQTGSIKPSDNKEHARHFDSTVNSVRDCIGRLNAIIKDLDKRMCEYTVDDIVEKYMSSDTIVGFISFARKHIQDTRHLGKLTTADHYASALSSLIRYQGTEEIPFETFDHKLISGFETYLKEQNLCPNTTSYYMRSLRSIYNNAVEQDMTECRDPFRRVFTGVEKTVKRSVPVDMVKALLRLDLGVDTTLALARDLFVFSVYTRGMAFIDLVYLRKSNICNGYIKYRRHKTARQLCIKLEKPMSEIIERYRSDESEYVFPLIKTGEREIRQQYLSAYKIMSRRLRKLGEMIGTTENLTFHRARHTWASAAKRNKVPLSVIKEGMGHDSERTTQIYLDSIDSEDLDNANSAIIGLFNN